MLRGIGSNKRVAQVDTREDDMLRNVLKSDGFVDVLSLAILS
jgi:hypothetical protein